MPKFSILQEQILKTSLSKNYQETKLAFNKFYESCTDSDGRERLISDFNKADKAYRELEKKLHIKIITT